MVQYFFIGNIEMIRLKIGSLTICMEFSFFAAVTLMLLCSGSSYALYSFYACILHECGHLVMMIILGQRVKKLVFYGAGIKIIPHRNCEAESFTAETAVLAAGCAVNFTVFAAARISGVQELRDFGIANLVIGTFNMLPLSFLDGGKIIIQCMYRFMCVEKAVRSENLFKYFTIIIVPVTALLLLFAGVKNFTVYATLIFLMISSFAA